MNARKGIGTIGVVIVCIAVVSLLGIAYAAFSSTLSISGSATVSSTKWEIKFTSATKNTSNTTSGISVTNPTVTNTTISDWSATLAKPGNKVQFDIRVTNGGDYAAKYSSMSGLTATCAKTTNGTDAEATNVCKYISYTLTKSDGSALSTSDTIAAGAYLDLKLTLEYKTKTVSGNNDMVVGDLPAHPVTVTAGTTTLTFVQA